MQKAESNANGVKKLFGNHIESGENKWVKSFDQYQTLVGRTFASHCEQMSKVWPEMDGKSKNLEEWPTDSLSVCL